MRERDPASRGGAARIPRLRLRPTIRLKLAAVSAALTFLILCLFAVVIGAVAEDRIRAGFEDDMLATAADLQEGITVEPDASGRLQLDGEDLELVRFTDAGEAVVRIVNLRGDVVVRSRTGEELGEPAEGVSEVDGLLVVSRQLVAPTLERSGEGPFQVLPRPVAEPVGYVQYAKPKHTVQSTVDRVRVFLGLGVLGGTLLAFLGGFLVARRAMRPIADLTRAAREVARTRDPDVTLPKPEARDEVADLAHTLEDMLSELGAARSETEASLTRQRQFVADASHELRTPLTSILANLELLEAELAGEQREIAGSALRSSNRMRRLVADLLLLARADAGRRSPRRAVDLAEVAREAAGEAGALSSDHPVSLDLPAQVPVEGAADDLHRLAGNLVENALVHTPPGTPVTVSVGREGPAAVLEVADRGPGIPEAMRERVFARFARGDGDRAPAGGSGLGLAIVRAVAEGHGGRVELREAEGGGARFKVALPAADAPAPSPAQPSLEREAPG